MKNFNRIGVLLVALAPLASQVSAQSILTPTTTTAALTASGTSIVVTSATPNAQSGDNPAANRGAIIDGEYMTISNTYVSGTTIPVQRGQGGTVATGHASGAAVWFGAPSHLGTKSVLQPAGGNCVRTNEPVLPYVNAQTQTVTDCIGGYWVRGNNLPIAPFRVPSPNPGGTVYTGINTSGTAVGATTLYCSELDLPGNKLLTGLSVLNGTTVTGNARYVILYDSAGVALANSALAGQASVTASIYENYAFTTKYFAVGPARYFACLQDNAVGSTTVRMAVTGQGDQLLTKGQTGATFGTVPVLVPPTTFTTAVGAYFSAY